MKTDNLHVNGVRKKYLGRLLNYIKSNVLRKRFVVLFVIKISEKLMKRSIDQNACSNKWLLSRKISKFFMSKILSWKKECSNCKMSYNNLEKVYIFLHRSAWDDSKFFDEDKIVVKKIVLKRFTENKKQYL